MKRVTFLVCVAAMFGNFALGAETASKPIETQKVPVVTVEQRQKMAGLHEKMAVCLRSERPILECRKEMMKGCKDTMGKDSCPMMGCKMGHGMHGHMMDGQETEKE